MELQNGRRLLAIPSRARLERVLRYLLDESEFLAAYGIRSLSRFHEAHPYRVSLAGEERGVDYEPAESRTPLFGGNSNWRGPVWFPVNFLLIEALERYHHFYGDGFRVEFPTGSGRTITLKEAAREISRRLVGLFRRNGGSPSMAAYPAEWQSLTLFHEYFHPETGRGLGASHQTGWTALIVKLLVDVCRESGL